MTMPVAVITDSTACIPPNLAEQWGITVVGMQVSVDGSVNDENRVRTDELIGALRRNAPVSTAPPDPGAFFWAYSDAVGRGARGIVSVHLSGQLSDTVAVAREVSGADWPIPVRVVDSHSVAMGLGFAALSAARIAETGGDIERVRQAAMRGGERNTHLLYVDTLEYLRRGKRIGAAAALIGSAFAVKPVLTVANGQLEPLGNALGSGRGVRKLIDSAVRRAGDKPVNIALEYFDTDQHIPEIRRQLEQRVPAIKDIVTTRVTAVLGAHCGPGAVGVSISPA